MPKQPVDLEVIHDEFKHFHEDYMTLVMATVDEQGEPYASYTPYVEVEGQFYIYVSELAAHTRNLLYRSDVSVFFIENKSQANHLFGQRRVNYRFKAQEVLCESEQFATIMSRFAEQFGLLIDKTLFHLSDFHLFRLQTVSAVYIQGFVKAFEFNGSRLHDMRHINDAGHRTNSTSVRHQFTDAELAGTGKVMACGISLAARAGEFKWLKHAIRAQSLGVLVFCVFLFGQSSPVCAAGANADMSGKPVQRVVSAAGALTEIMYALGEQDRLVGVDTTSTYPLQALKLPRVGYMRNLSAEGVLSLTPDLVLATSEAGPPVVLEQIRGAGIPIAQLASDYSLKSVSDHMRAVAVLLGMPEAGARLVSEFESDASELRKVISGLKGRPKVAFLLNVGNGSPMVSGRNTAADAMIHLAGAVNAFTDYGGYKPVSAEAMIAKAPEILLVTTSTLELSGGIRGLLGFPGIGLTPAGRQARIIAMDGLYLLGFGPRTVQAARELAGRLRSPNDVPTGRAK